MFRKIGHRDGLETDWQWLAVEDDSGRKRPRWWTLIPAIALILSVIVGAGILLSAPAVADDADVRGPSCSDIVDGTGSFDGSTVNFTVETARASCRGITYTLFVTDVSCPQEFGPCLDGTAPLVASQVARGNRTTEVTFIVDAVSSDGDDRVCLYVTSSAGLRVFDRAPDSGCMIREAEVDLGTPFDCLVICDSCADFVSGDSLDRFTFVANTASPTCPEVTYTVEFLDRLDGTVVRSESVMGDGTSQIVFDLTPLPGEDTLTVLAKSSYGGHVLDVGGICCALRFH